MSYLSSSILSLVDVIQAVIDIWINRFIDVLIDLSGGGRWDYFLIDRFSSVVISALHSRTLARYMCLD